VACPAAARDAAACLLADPMVEIAEIPVRFILFHATAAHLNRLAMTQTTTMRSRLRRHASGNDAAMTRLNKEISRRLAT